MTNKTYSKNNNRLPRLIHIFSLTLIFILGVFIFPQNINAQTWDGGGTTNNWSDRFNWSGDSVPGFNASIIFDSTSSKNSVIDINQSPNIQVLSGYTGEITHSVDLGIKNMDLNSGTFTASSNLLHGGQFKMDGGVFNAGSGSLAFSFLFISSGTFNGGNTPFSTTTNLGLLGGTFNSSAPTVSLGGLVIISGATVNQTIGTLIIRGNATLESPLTLNNVTVDGSLTVSLETLTVNGTLNLNNGNVVFGTGKLEAKGDINVSAIFGSGNGGIDITGSANQTFTNNGGANPTGEFTLNKTGGTLNLASDLQLSSGNTNINFTSGTITTNGNIVDLGSRNVTSSGGYVIGNLRRLFQSFVLFPKTFDVGTANGYSPVNVTPTAVVSTTGFTVSAIQGAHPNSPFAINALQRYWTLTESGDITATLTFNYLQSDVPAFINESDLELRRYTGSRIIFDLIPATQNKTNNTMTTDSPISDFSDWAMFPLGPTAANTTVGGKVETSKGRGIPRAYVSLTDQNGSIRTIRTNHFGYFNFRNVMVGETYTVSVRHKTYEFVNPTQLINVGEAITDLKFTAENPVSRNNRAIISGKVLNQKSVGIPDVKVKLFGGGLENPIYISTDKDGKYTFENIKVGNSYILSVENLKLKIKEPTKSFYLADSIENIDFKSVNY